MTSLKEAQLKEAETRTGNGQPSLPKVSSPVSEAGMWGEPNGEGPKISDLGFGACNLWRMGKALGEGNAVTRAKWDVRTLKSGSRELDELYTYSYPFTMENN